MTVFPDYIYTEGASVCAGIAAVTDLRSRRIPNWLTGSGLLAGLVLHLVLGGPRDAAFSLFAALVAGGIFFLLFIAGGMGAGDVKLMAAVGALAGVHSLRNVLISTVILGAVSAVVSAAASGRLRETLRNTRELFAHHQSHGLLSHPHLNVRNTAMLRLPYALPIAGGCVVTTLLCLYGGTAL